MSNGVNSSMSFNTVLFGDDDIVGWSICVCEKRVEEERGEGLLLFGE